MSTPSRTPHRICIPHIDTSAGRLKEDYRQYCGWETPLSAQDRRRPSLTYSALSEPSPISLPTTPGYYSASSSVYSPHGIAAPMRMMNHVKAESDLARTMQGHALCYDMLPGNDAKYHSNTLMSPMHDPLAAAFSQNTSSGWEGIPACNQPVLFRPSTAQTIDSYTTVDSMNKALFNDPLISQLQPAISACPPTFDNMNAFNPHQLIIPSDVQDDDGYAYVHPVDSSMTSPIEQISMHSGSFDSYTSMSPWSQTGAASPINQYSLPSEEMLSSSTMTIKDQSPGQNLMDHYDPSYEPFTPRRSRYRTRPGSANKRRSAVTHQIAHNSYGIDVAMDSKGCRVDSTGRIIKKDVGLDTKRFKCTFPGCESRSARKEHLRRHELSHKPDKQFHCNLEKCNRAITRSDNLIQHLMTHVRPRKPGKRNNHHSPKRVEQMVMESMEDPKLAERTITNLRKAIEREQDKWPCTNLDMDEQLDDISEDGGDDDKDDVCDMDVEDSFDLKHES